MNTVSNNLVTTSVANRVPSSFIEFIFGPFEDPIAIEEEKQNRQNALQEISSMCQDSSPEKIEQSIKLHNKYYKSLNEPFCDLFILGGIKWKTNNANETTYRYSGGFYELLSLGASLKQLKNWSRAIYELETRFLPTEEFTKGYIDLFKAGATDKELKLYTKAVTYFLTTYREEFLPDDMIHTFVEAAERDDMSQEYRLNLMRDEVHKVSAAWLIKYTKRAITIANVAKVGFIGSALYNIIMAL